MGRPSATAWGTIFFGIFLVVAIALADLLFSKRDVEEGEIMEMVFVPGKTVGVDIAYSRVRTRDYFIEAQKDDQWIAIVKNDKGETLQVHYTREHYNAKKPGDRIQYKKYQGRLIHIKYFSHNEEL